MKLIDSCWLQVVEGEPIITHGGKIQKIATLAAGLCSVRFQQHMRDQVFDKERESRVLLILLLCIFLSFCTEGNCFVFPQLLEKLDWTHFDARAFSLPNTSEVLVCLFGIHTSIVEIYFVLFVEKYHLEASGL